jgi:hypothetical protein
VIFPAWIYCRYLQVLENIQYRLPACKRTGPTKLLLSVSISRYFWLLFSRGSKYIKFCNYKRPTLKKTDPLTFPLILLLTSDKS